MNWTVLRDAGRNPRGQKLVEARCVCNTIKVLTEDSIKRGLSKSCGCTKTTNGHSRALGGKPSATYVSWQSMKTRCLNPKSSDFPRYGARGIAVCESWLDFDNFLKDMGERPEGHTLDRIDPEGNYCKTNCQWATYKTQRANQRLHKRSVKCPQV